MARWTDYPRMPLWTHPGNLGYLTRTPRQNAIVGVSTDRSDEGDPTIAFQIVDGSTGTIG